MFMTGSIFISILRQYKRSSKRIPQFTGKLYEFSKKNSSAENTDQQSCKPKTRRYIKARTLKRFLSRSLLKGQREI